MSYSDYRVRSIDCTRLPNSSRGLKKHKRISKSCVEKIMELYNAGMNRTQIARELNVAIVTVTKYLTDYGKFKPVHDAYVNSVYPYDGTRFRVAKMCRKYVLIDKISPRWSTEKMSIEEIIGDSDNVSDMVQAAKKMERVYGNRK